jgi:hypothetical protein
VIRGILVSTAETRFSAGARKSRPGKDYDMLWFIACILMLLWLVGVVTLYTFGGFIHVLLGISLVMVAFRLIKGKQSARE